MAIRWSSGVHQTHPSAMQNERRNTKTIAPFAFSEADSPAAPVAMSLVRLCSQQFRFWIYYRPTCGYSESGGGGDEAGD